MVENIQDSQLHNGTQIFKRSTYTVLTQLIVHTRTVHVYFGQIVSEIACTTLYTNRSPNLTTQHSFLSCYKPPWTSEQLRTHNIKYKFM